jgi:hypothetical protein
MAGRTMKEITTRHFRTLADGIMKERERRAKRDNAPLTSISGEELCREVEAQLGGKFAVKKDEEVRFTRADIDAVAGSRFYKKTGFKMLVITAILVVGLGLSTKYIPNMETWHYTLYYCAFAVIALGFLYIYSKGKARIRKELWHQMGREEGDEE